MVFFCFLRAALMPLLKYAGAALYKCEFLCIMLLLGSMCHEALYLLQLLDLAEPVVWESPVLGNPHICAYMSMKIYHWDLVVSHVVLKIEMMS